MRIACAGLGLLAVLYSKDWLMAAATPLPGGVDSTERGGGGPGGPALAKGTWLWDGKELPDATLAKYTPPLRVPPNVAADPAFPEFAATMRVNGLTRYVEAAARHRAVVSHRTFTADAPLARWNRNVLSPQAPATPPERDAQDGDAARGTDTDTGTGTGTGTEAGAVDRLRRRPDEPDRVSSSRAAALLGPEQLFRMRVADPSLYPSRSLSLTDLKTGAAVRAMETRKLGAGLDTLDFHRLRAPAL